MKRISITPVWLLLLAMATVACCSSGKTNRSVPTTIITASDSIPACVRKMIGTYQAEEKQNPPRQVFEYTYQGKKVYYVTPPCCDFFSELYDSNCNLIAYPDGGITGKGDGRAPDFILERKDEKLIWKDERKQ